MAKVLKMLYHEMYYYLEENKDRRLEHYFLLGSPLKLISILSLYLYFVHDFGPKFMAKRKPYDLKYIMMVYNLVQVFANFILGSLMFTVFYKNIGNLNCVLVNYSNDPEGIFHGRLAYSYYILKILDLLDTIFFVLRKRYNQVTFLHVYHHVTMAYASYICVHYLAGGQYGFIGLVNCFVHSVMYFYYFLTAFKPELKQSIWWKKHITQIQIVQFLLIVVFYMRPILTPNCPLSKFLLTLGIIQNTFMLAMFSDFYYKAYIKKAKKHN